MRTKFNLVFKDPDFYDWYFTLHTSTPKTEEDIENLIEYSIEVCSRNIEDYSPVDIMDHLVDFKNNIDGEDWYWTDNDDDEVLIRDWR